MMLLSLYVTLALGVSFVCSIMEAVLLSVTPAYIGALQKERPLAAILSLNTVAHTMGAAGAGAQAAAVFWKHRDRSLLGAPHFGHPCVERDHTQDDRGALLAATGPAGRPYSGPDDLASLSARLDLPVNYGIDFASPRCCGRSES